MAEGWSKVTLTYRDAIEKGLDDLHRHQERIIRKEMLALGLDPTRPETLVAQVEARFPGKELVLETSTRQWHYGGEAGRVGGEAGRVAWEVWLRLVDKRPLMYAGPIPEQWQ